MSGYSTDLRERVIGLREKGETQARIGELLAISVSTVKRYLERYARTGSVAATVQGRMKPKLSAAELAVIEAQLAMHNDWTIAQHLAAFCQHSGLAVSVSTLGRALRGLGWTRKKRQWGRANAIR